MAVELTSDHLELGNPAKGLSGSTGRASFAIRFYVGFIGIVGLTIAPQMLG